MVELVISEMSRIMFVISPRPTPANMKGREAFLFLFYFCKVFSFIFAKCGCKSPLYIMPTALEMKMKIMASANTCQICV
jgi:hypothetical protein